MHPILVDFHWHSLYLGTYGLFFAAAAFIGWLLWIRQARIDGLDVDRLMDLGFYALLAGVLGSKIGLILTDPGYYLTSLGALTSTIRAAGVLLVGVIAAILVILFYTKRHGLPFWAVGDSMAPSLAIGQAIGRLGCLAAGCCYGMRAPDLPWAIRFTDKTAAEISGTPLYRADDPVLSMNSLHPTQIYQALADFLLFLLLFLTARRRSFQGQTSLMFIAIYSLSRGIVEFYRGDMERGVYHVFGSGFYVSTSQFISIAGIVFVAFAWPVLARRRSARGGVR
jgi:phosphatidylglycerol:prolipoprotein diacylglycerol transferase